MQEEIFDPVLTILTYGEFDEIFDIMHRPYKKESYKKLLKKFMK